MSCQAMKRRGGEDCILLRESQGFPGASVLRNPPANQETWVWRSERSPGAGNGNPYQYSCPEDPTDWGPGRLQSIGWQRVRHDLAIAQQEKVHLISTIRHSGRDKTGVREKISSYQGLEERERRRVGAQRVSGQQHHVVWFCSDGCTASNTSANSPRVQHQEWPTRWAVDSE